MTDLPNGSFRAYRPRTMGACYSCGKENSPEGRFCAHCGTPLGRTCQECNAPAPAQARFCPSCGIPLGEGHRATSTSEMLKVVTILFADVVGSTARAEKMHPEDTRALMTDFFRAMSEEIEAQGGLVERIVGDGIMADFGVPIAHEDDPVRAVRAAVAMLERLERWNTKRDPESQIEIRVGINTGEVSAAGDPGQDLLVTGDPVNVAARLEQAAAPGSIVIGERTARSVRDRFLLEPLESVVAKGKSDPVPAFRVKGPVAEPSTETATGPPLIGRADELTSLVEAFERCRRTDSPHLVTLLGDAGVGKTRLTQEFLLNLPVNCRVLIGNCVTHGAGVDLSPLQEILRKQAGFVATDDAARMRDRIAALVEKHGLQRSTQTIDALASTVGAQSESVEGLDPRVRRRDFLSAWRSLLSALAAGAPVVVVIQDIHWAGELLLDTLRDLACRTEGSLLFLCSARPDLLEQKPDWGTAASSHVALRLKPLSDEQSAELINGLFDVEGLPDEQRQIVLERCEGNPFFLQEVVRHLVDSGHLVQAEGEFKIAGPMSSLEIPDTVQGVLLARIDLMDERSKRLGQQAAVFGRTFWEGALAELCGDQQLRESLATLERRAFITESSTSTIADEVEYAFNHILIRDALYNSMPRRLRGASHEIIASSIEDKRGERSQEDVEMIAHHYEHAYELLEREDLRAKAREHLLVASKNALQRSAVKRASVLAQRAVTLSKGITERLEALEVSGDQAMMGYRIDDAWSCFCQALSEVAHEAPAPAIARLAAKAAIAATRYEGAMQYSPSDEEIVEKIKLGLAALEGAPDETWVRCLLLTSQAFEVNYRAEDREDAAAKALSLAEELGDPALISVALDGGAFALSPQLRFGDIFAVQQRRVALAPKIKDLNEVCDIFGSACWSAYLVGRYEETISYADECLRQAKGLSPGEYQHALQWRVMANFRTGRWDEALRDQAELESLVFEEGEDAVPVFASGAFSTAALCRQLRGDIEAADRYLKMIERLRVEQEAADEGSGQLRPAAALTLAHMGRVEEALEWLDYRQEGFTSGIILEASCEVVREKGDLGSATAFVERCQAAVSKMGNPALQCYLDRLEAWIAHATGDDRKAETLFEDSARGFARLQMPWEEAMSRLLQAEHRLSISVGTSGHELTRVLAVFENLGSVREAERARNLLAGASPQTD